MSFVSALVVGGSIISGAMQSKAQKRAAAAQSAAAEAGIEEQRRQFDEVQKLLAPFISTGTDALSQQAALIGVGGAEAQRAAISAIEQGPEFQALTRQGEEAILQRAAATGGLRGGNVQAALAQFRPQVLSGLIEQQYNRLGGLSGMGQASAVGQAQFGQAASSNISNLMQQAGAAQAGGTLASAETWGNTFGNLGTAFGRGLAYKGYTPEGADAPLTFGQALVGGF